MSAYLQTQDLSVGYDGKALIQNVCLEVQKGKIVTLIGPNGSGKSTILNLVIGFNQAESGKVLVDGKDISQIDLRTYRKHLAVVPQTSILFSGTIRDNITYGIDDVDEDTMEAEFKDGILTISVSKVDEDKNKKYIEVK